MVLTHIAATRAVMSDWGHMVLWGTISAIPQVLERVSAFLATNFDQFRRHFGH
jgi:hypothetical protein